MEKQKNYEAYLKSTHRLGRIVSVITLILLVGAPFLIGTLLGAGPDLGAVARGFLSVGKLLQAMKCFETIILIQPRNAAAVHNFGMCLKKLGKTEMAEEVLHRAETLSRDPPL